MGLLNKSKDALNRYQTIEIPLQLPDAYNMYYIAKKNGLSEEISLLLGGIEFTTSILIHINPETGDYFIEECYETS